MQPPPAFLDWLIGTWAEAIRDLPDVNVWQFAEREIRLDPKQANNVGDYRLDWTPYTRLFQEAFTSTFTKIPDEDWWLRSLVARGERVDECFVVKSSQSGLTQAALNCLIYACLYAPGRVLYVLDSASKASSVSRLRVIPQLERLAQAVMTGDEDDLGMLFIELANMVIEFTGSYSPGVFAEKPLKYGFLDDIVYMAKEAGQAGMLGGTSVIDHIRSRFTTADESFLGVFSKPDLDDDDFIRNFRSGSQHSYWVPCPHCNARQVLEPEGLYFDYSACKDTTGRYDLQAVEELTTYRCAHCEKQIDEKHKYQMNNAGIWIPKSLEDRRKDEDPALFPRRLSMRINDLNSPFAKVKWGKLAILKIEAESNPAKQRFVQTNHWARPWRDKAINVKAEQVRALIAGALDPKTGKHYKDDLDGEGRLKVPPYKRGECPFRPVLVSATSDVQGDQFKWQIWGWKIDGTAALIEYGATLAKKDLHALIHEPRSHAGYPLVSLVDPERPLVPETGLIDSGHDTFVIYQFCIDSDAVWFPSKGVPGYSLGGNLVEGKDDWHEGESFVRYNYNDYAVKTWFYGAKIKHAHNANRPTPRLYLPYDVGDDFIVEWTSESLQPRKLSSNTKLMEWVHDKTIGPNDWGDGGKMQYVIWQIMLPVLREREEKAKRAAQAAQPKLILPPVKPSRPTLADIIEAAKTK